MLNFFREYARSWLIKGMLSLIAVAFVSWGGYSYTHREAGQVASVDGHNITAADFKQSYDQLVEMYRRQLGKSFSQELVRQLDLKKQALDMMVNRYLLAKAAQRLGLSATAQEVRQKILEYPVFQTDGNFDQKRYVFILQQNHLTPEMFENQVAEDLSIQKLQSFIERQAAVNDQDISADFRFNYGQIQLAYVTVNSKSLEPQVVVDDKALQSYFEAHQERYREPEKRELPFVLFKTEDYTKDVQVTEEQMKQYYQDHQSDYHKQKEVRAKHILFAVKEDAPEQEVAKVKAEAQKVLDEARKGKDFSELAKKYSQDPTAAKNGGDLGYFTRAQMVPAFSDAAFALKPGDISELVRTPYGFHIIKVEDVHPEKTIPFEEAKSQIEQTLKQDKARDIAYAKARDFADAAYAQRDIEKTAQNFKLQVTGSDTWLSRQDPLPGLDAASAQVVGKLFEMTDKETSKPLEVPQGLIVAQVKAIQAPKVPDFESVKSRVEQDFRSEQATKMAQENAVALLASAREAKSLESLAKDKKLDVKKTGWFSRREPDKELRLSGEAQNKVFGLEETDPFPGEPLQSGDRFIICQLLGKKTPDDLLEKERASIYKRLLQEKQSQMWQAWVEQLRKKADVKMYKEGYDRLGG